MSQVRFVPLAAIVLLMCLALLPASPAQACGGFFCSANAPVNQAAERIIFAKNANNTVTAVIQIQYSGPSEEFAWVLPVPGVPDVKVSSDLAFQRLQTASNPQYLATRVIEGQCRSGGTLPFAFGPTNNDGLLDNNASFPMGSRDVEVLAAGTIGPYDFVVIQPDSSLESLGQVAVDWLTTEGYDVVPAGGDPDSVASMLGTYLADGMNLLAFRLSKGNEAGTIRPVRITFDSDAPMIPIRPTAVAANDDMGVMVWVLGESRAVPINYRSLELNEALIDWRQAGINYNQVVIAAANEAGGQGFVTERSGDSEDYRDLIVQPFERDDWNFLLDNFDSLVTSQLVNQVTALLQFWDGFADVAVRFLPGRIDSSGFFQCTGCGQLNASDLEKAAFMHALANEVVDPMIETQDLLLSRPYATRLYTTLSAPEMDRDPVFDFNPDLGDASNVHNATWVIECNRRVFPSEAPSRFELEDGQIVRVSPFEPWPFVAGGPEAPPANALVLQLSTSGQGEIVEDNRAAIGVILDDHNDGVPTSGGGCSVSSNGSAPVGATAALVLLGLCVLRRGSGLSRA